MKNIAQRAYPEIVVAPSIAYLGCKFDKFRGWGGQAAFTERPAKLKSRWGAKSRVAYYSYCVLYTN